METITAEEIIELQKAKKSFVLLNVLNPESHDKVHIAESINIPVRLPGFEEKVLQQLSDKEQLIITYCTSYD